MLCPRLSPAFSPSRAIAPIESARSKSVMLCQRFERRMRQCGAELRISTTVARPNRFQPTETCRQPSSR
jgi:hypothetical protein